jgi:hypothetical protein
VYYSPPVAGDHVQFKKKLISQDDVFKTKQKKKMLLSVQYVAKILHTSHLYPTTTTTEILKDIT